ncbi:MAG: 2-phospho-L-lactate guanylyltransferase [Acidimicrobiia bacterium]|nr:2-phospho-L-lactate guanylyltransferase [Acidimicrobiia bacterium]MDH3399251.1 2-phospho-L-lactate guanylyltransferase [Acidimicrobiia bacterium]
MSSPQVLIAIPVKPFGVAKQRLAPVLNPKQRRRLGKAVAAHVITTALDTGCAVGVVTDNEGVAEWARRLGASTIAEPLEGGLNGAATGAVEAARRMGLGWMILHADLPTLTPADLSEALAATPEGGVLLAPSHNGGTSLITAELESFPFTYGQASFRRHFAAVAPLTHRVLVRPGLAIDLDGPEDLATAVGLPAGRWLEPLLPVLIGGSVGVFRSDPTAPLA